MADPLASSNPATYHEMFAADGSVRPHYGRFLQRLEALMSRYQPQSVVSRIHLAAGVTPDTCNQSAPASSAGQSCAPPPARAL